LLKTELKMTGVVICGGQSTRMGTDKGLLKQFDVSWAETAFSKLRSFNLPVVVSVNKGQVDVYSKIFLPNQLVADDEKISVRGPLLGLLSIHQHLPDEDLLVLACDMIDMEKGLLQNLLAVQKNNSHQAYMYAVDGRLQPLCGYYTSGGLKYLFQLNQQQKLKKFSVIYALECVNTKYIPVDPGFINCFANYNSPADLLQ